MKILFLNGEDITTQGRAHICAVATVLLITKRERERQRQRQRQRDRQRQRQRQICTNIKQDIAGTIQYTAMYRNQTFVATIQQKDHTSKPGRHHYCQHYKRSKHNQSTSRRALEQQAASANQRPRIAQKTGSREERTRTKFFSTSVLLSKYSMNVNNVVKN